MRSRCVGVLLATLVYVGSSLMPAAWAVEPAKTAISDEATAAVQQMGKTLAVADMSFKAQTIRVYEDVQGPAAAYLPHNDDCRAPAGSARDQGHRRRWIAGNVL